MRNPFVAISIPALLAYAIAGKSVYTIAAVILVAVAFYATRSMGTKTRLTIIVVVALAGALGAEIVRMIYSYVLAAGSGPSQSFMTALLDALIVAGVFWIAMFLDHRLRSFLRRRKGGD